MSSVEDWNQARGEMGLKTQRSAQLDFVRLSDFMQTYLFFYSRGLGWAKIGTGCLRNARLGGQNG